MKVKKQVRKKTTKKKHVVGAFPVVAIGASLGGLKAVLQLLKNLPSNTGMAYIYVQHLSPSHKSFLTDILSKATNMRVQEIEDMEHIMPDNVYVIPYNKGIEVTNGHIKLLPRSKASAAISIDILFSSLAITHKKNVIGIILSGNGADGTKGLEAIKNAGGMTYAQDSSAQANSMPQSAIATGLVDFVLSPKKIALALANFSKHGFKRPNLETQKEDAGPDTKDALKTILSLLNKKTGVDFTNYKTATIKRRIQQRMRKDNIKTLKGYQNLLLKKNDEIDLLYKDLLINVTSFFRDAEAFRYLKTSLLPKLLRNKTPDKTLRIWVPACSTGEEAYSLGMLIIELQETGSRKIPVQIFATDLSKSAIQKARLSEYSESDMKPVSLSRQKRFFTKTGSTYRVVKELREMCVFAPHNILKDPPFFRIDIISCCNLLIYFDVIAQKKALSIMHFSLNENGHLMLGKSESTVAAPSLFSQVSNKFKIYQRKKISGTRRVPNAVPGIPQKLFSLNNKNIPSSKHEDHFPELDAVIDEALLKNYMPACAIINKDMEIMQFRGSASTYLVHPQGKATLNILKMARPEFAIELRSSISKAFATNKAVPPIEVELNSELVRSQMVTIEVSPLKTEWDEVLLLVVFTQQKQSGDDTEEKKTVTTAAITRRNQRIKKLVHELTRIRGEMHAIIEAHETSYQELQVANEEIVSANEEFQTLNEELETSKEEIEASNEELISTNQELNIRNSMLEESYNYSEAIINTLHEPMIVLNEKLQIKSASKSFYKKFHSSKEETEGKSLFELGNKQWDIPDLHKLLKDVSAKNLNFDNFEVTHVFPGIGEKIMLLNAHRIVQKTHKEQLILLAINDITERSRQYIKEKELLARDIRSHQANTIELERAVKRRTKQLELKNKELENANKDLTSFTYVSSHDLQEPLRKIQNFATVILLEEEKNLSSNGKNYFLRMREVAKRMQSLIEDLLKYSRAKNDEHGFEDTDLKLLFNEVKKDFEETIHEKKAKIIIKSFGVAKVIPFQFRQLIHNLISNSLKFSKANVAPRITIQSEVVTKKEIKELKLLPGKKYLHIKYTDNGIGFDAQYKERIFEVFQRLHSFDEYHGTGIGLAICKRIIENHNGVITADGKVNHGARFDIYIPR